MPTIFSVFVRRLTQPKRLVRIPNALYSLNPLPFTGAVTSVFGEETR